MKSIINERLGTEMSVLKSIAATILPKFKNLWSIWFGIKINLLKMPTGEQKTIFEKFGNRWSEYVSCIEEAIFECAF